ncbi:mannosyltransferase putative-domain-containing protein [Zopfochytrium polystomum]|nr:mannosyltransferase putative-domain-containing protein [Zopfochytrium polystomum]
MLLLAALAVAGLLSLAAPFVVVRVYRHRHPAPASSSSPSSPLPPPSATSTSSPPPPPPPPVQPQQPVPPLTATDLAQQSKWRAYMSQLGTYDDHDEAHKTSSSMRPRKGVVLTGSGGWVDNAVMAALFLRETGCALPVSFAYIDGQLSADALAKLRAYNVTPFDISATVSRYGWTSDELGMGGPKLDAILAAPYEQVLFLDPDVMPLRDPSFLFDSHAFARHGALFWPDLPRRNRASIMWRVMGLLEDEVAAKGEAQQTTRVNELLEVESGIVLVDKRRAWRGLKLAEHMAAEGRYYFKHFHGDKETFFWGFKASGTPFFQNPNYLYMVGRLVSSDHPLGGAPARSSGGGHITLPIGTRFCGQSMVQLDFEDSPDADDDGRSGRPRHPLFVHWNGVKYSYHADRDPFAVAQTFVPAAGRAAAEYPDVHYDWDWELHGLKHCVALPGGLEVPTFPPSTRTSRRSFTGCGRRRTRTHGSRLASERRKLPPLKQNAVSWLEGQVEAGEREFVERGRSMRGKE